MDVRVGLWRKLSFKELMLLNCGAGEDSWESLGLQGDPTSPSQRRSVLAVHWKDWCGSWNSNTLATWCKELTDWKRPWCWERLREGGEGDDRGWDGWMASPTQWTWVWVDSGSWWWTGRPDVLLFTGSQRVGHDWVTELNWSAWFYKHLQTVISSVILNDTGLCWVTFDEKRQRFFISLFTINNFLKIRVISLLQWQWQPTPVLLPGKSHGRRNLIGCSLWGCTESDTTEAT